MSGATNPLCQTDEYPATGACYWVTPLQRKSWPDALTSCEEEGGTLAMLYDEDLHNFIDNAPVPLSE